MDTRHQGVRWIGTGVGLDSAKRAPIDHRSSKSHGEPWGPWGLLCIFKETISC